MAGLGIGLGIFVFLLVGAITGECITTDDKGAGVFPGLVAAVWVAWPFFHNAGVSRYNFLHPVPKEYKQPLKQAFAQIRDILADTSYNFGDKWNIATADAMQKRILASLRFTEEESRGFEGTNLSNIHTNLCRGNDIVSTRKFLLFREVSFQGPSSQTSGVR